MSPLEYIRETFRDPSPMAVTIFLAIVVPGTFMILAACLMRAAGMVQ